MLLDVPSPLSHPLKHFCGPTPNFVASFVFLFPTSAPRATTGGSALTVRASGRCRVFVRDAGL